MAKLSHCRVRLQADPSRVVIRPFHIGVDPAAPDSRAQRLVDAVREMDMRTVQAELALVTKDFEARHWQTRQVFMRRYAQIREEVGIEGKLRPQQQELIGAYFCHEYSYAAAALMNPSAALHPDQWGMGEGSVRFVMSLRAVGEGHISSIAFREGVLTANGRLDLTPEPPSAEAADVVEANPEPDASGAVTVRCNGNGPVSGTVLFPITAQQRNGLEDLRLIRFQDGDEEPIYYGTYTAYSGSRIASELLITKDFKTFKLQPLTGAAARNKGMGLFPRRVGGAYCMIGRQDGESIFFLKSDSLTQWDEGEKIAAPKYPWDLVQMGNCGAPIEIDEGWLLLTHGVGAMRQYSIGCMLLDKDDPTKVLGRTERPVLSPADEDREGYVPNVVYSCGGMAVGRRLFLPYGVADSSVAFCWLELDELIAEMR
jgi:predicted GH43/DUF377 family glycosyl hydrolase